MMPPPAAFWLVLPEITLPSKSREPKETLMAPPVPAAWLAVITQFLIVNLPFGSPVATLKPSNWMYGMTTIV